MSNPGMMLTKNGKLVLAKALTGLELRFSKVAYGDGDFDYATESVEDLTELRNWRMDLPIVGKEVEGNGCALIKAQLCNYDLAEGFAAKEIGVFAFDPESGAEVLYAYRNAGEEYNYIPAGGGAVAKNTTFAYRVEIQNAEKITAVIDFSFVYVSENDFEKHTQSYHPQQMADVENPNALWVTDFDDNLHRLPIDAAKELFASSLNIPENADFQKMQLMLQNSFELGLDGNFILIEDFKPVMTIDATKVQVNQAVQGAAVLGVNSLSGLTTNCEYFISDGVNIESVIISDINFAEKLSVRLTTALEKTYNLAHCYLYRSTADISDHAEMYENALNYTYNFNTEFKGYKAHIERAVELDLSDDNRQGALIFGCGKLENGYFTLR